MNGRQIEIFHAVMKAGTITEAAMRLGITQPAVTSSLKQIESQLGFNLFQRYGGRLHPTAEAITLNLEAERIQDSLGVFRQLAERLKTDLTSHLRIVTPAAFSHTLVPEAIGEFMAVDKDCLIHVTTKHHNQILIDIGNLGGQNTLGITFGNIDKKGIGTIPVGRAEIVALIPDHWELAHQTSVSVSQLSEKPLIATFAGEPLGNAIEDLMHKNNVKANYVIRVHNHSVAASLAHKGIGAAIIDSVTASHTMSFKRKANYKILPVTDAPPLPINAVFSYEHSLNEHAKRFITKFRKSLYLIDSYASDAL
jgi:DNA-binding transcriptional LysR family regulator